MKRHSLFPARALKFRFRGESLDVTQAKVSYRKNVFGNVEHGSQSNRIENADPANADTFSAGGEPEILHSAYGRVSGGFGHGMPA
jgi:hypothetical protein